MSIKALTRKVDQLTRLAQQQQDDGPVEFVLYTYDNPPPPGTKIDYEIDFGLAFLSEEEQEEILRQRNSPILEDEDDT